MDAQEKYELLLDKQLKREELRERNRKYALGCMFVLMVAVAIILMIVILSVTTSS